jgi:hypothetical protein
MAAMIFKAPRESRAVFAIDIEDLFEQAPNSYAPARPAR